MNESLLTLQTNTWMFRWGHKRATAADHMIQKQLKQSNGTDIFTFHSCAVTKGLKHLIIRSNEMNVCLNYWLNHFMCKFKVCAYLRHVFFSKQQLIVFIYSDCISEMWMFYFIIIKYLKCLTVFRLSVCLSWAVMFTLFHISNTREVKSATRCLSIRTKVVVWCHHEAVWDHGICFCHC